SGASKDLLQHTIAKPWRIGQADARCEVLVMCWGKRGRNARIARHHPSARGGRELCRLQSGHNGFNLSLRVVPRHAHLPAQAEIQREVRFHLPCVLTVSAPVTRSGIQKLRTALVEATISVSPNEE